jgi:hypothetical protein
MLAGQGLFAFQGERVTHQPREESGLGFDYLVDELVVALMEPRLLPLTIGVLGDWGSGKSSLMRMARSVLETAGEEGDGRYVCVSFSPWQHEDYEDVKAALMTAVIDRLASEPGAASADAPERLGVMRQFLSRIRQRSYSLGRVAMSAAPAVVPAVAAGG